MEKVVIIGSGPAGLTAAIYAARGELDPLVISGKNPGGQLTITSDVEDYPGFPQGVQGPDLMISFRQQAERLGSRFLDEEVLSVDFSKKPFVVNTETMTLTASSVIVATGASAKWLGLESEYNLIGKGVSACAVCDAPFFKDKKVAVIGGGDVAMREAQHLSKLCKQVTVIHRRDVLRAQAALVETVKSKPNVNFVWNSEVVEILGDEKVAGVKVKSTETGKSDIVDVEGVFVAIGHNPATKFLQGQIKLDEREYIVITDETKTSVEGVFACGDAVDHTYRQAVTAAGSGCKAALDVEEYLEHIK